MKDIFIDRRGNVKIFPAGIVTSITIILFIGSLMFGLPIYKVWSQGMAGQAELARAEQNRNIAVREAQAKLDSAKLLNQAEIERAKGVAEANRIIGDSLKGNEAYLRYLWIQSIADKGEQAGEIIYIPTEAGMPILEAGKRE
jgi:regulator of protease activity HflC (stomatin/prohibitin superfamily)